VLGVKRKALALSFILIVLLSAVAQKHIFDLVFANPYWHGGFTKPPEDMQEQTITILSPQIKAVYESNNLTLRFNVSLNSTNTWYYIRLDRVYYKASWQNSSVSVYNWSHNVGMNPYDDDPRLTEFLYEGNLTEIPEGIQNITVTAYTKGGYVVGNVYYRFGTNITSSVIFMINSSPEPFPTTLVGTASIVTIVVFAVFLLVRKHKQ
jgi:hypothetical protein